MVLDDELVAEHGQVFVRRGLSPFDRGHSRGKPGRASWCHVREESAAAAANGNGAGRKLGETVPDGDAIGARVHCRAVVTSYIGIEASGDRRALAGTRT